MLKYLMKYDLRKMLKLLVWFYAISLALAALTRILYIWNDIQVIRIIGMVSAGFTYSAIANIVINTFIHILMRFTTSFYKDQSYLTHTLPVKKGELILSKYLSSLIVILLSVIVSFLSLFIMFYSPEFMQNLKFALDSVVAGFNMPSGLFVCLIVLIIFAQICAIISFAFTAIVKGYSYNHKRGIRGFLCFYLLCSITTLILSVILTAITGNIDSLLANQMSSETFLTVALVALISYSCFALLFYFICRKEFKKGVNID